MTTICSHIEAENFVAMFLLIVSTGEIGFSMVTLPLQTFPFMLQIKNILPRPLIFGMWVYMGKASEPIVLWPRPYTRRLVVAFSRSNLGYLVDNFKIFYLDVNHGAYGDIWVRSWSLLFSGLGSDSKTSCGLLKVILRVFL